ncbi:MAG: helicase HerA-like domain-containing protein [Pseudomonadota bacterium]
MTEPILLARQGSTSVHLLPAMANRHGLIAGATGTGKTITLRVLAEAFSRRGVPVFMADVKGDLSGLAAAGGDNPKVAARAQELAIADWKPEGFPVAFWDLWAEQGTPVRTTVAEFGPLLLARVMELNETQAGVLTLVFKVAEDEKHLLLDLKDLRAMLAHVAENAGKYQNTYGNVAAASVGAIQRALLALEQQGADRFFGEPALALTDFMQQRDGKGVVNILAADKLLASPRLYATFLLWMLGELFETLPEAGDLAQPKLVFFFDEAHLLFSDAPKALVDRIEQVVRLIRSKGVGVYFVTQNPVDIPETVLGQLGNRVQHALRAFSPREQKAVKSAAETFRPNPAVKVEQAITELGVGEALVSVLDAKGTPTMVERLLVAPPVSRIAPLSPAEKASRVSASPLHGKYLQTVDRESAHETLQKRLEQREDSDNSLRTAPAEEGAGAAGRVAAGGVLAMLGGGFVWLLKTVLRTIGYQIARDIAKRVTGRSTLPRASSTRRRR